MSPTIKPTEKIKVLFLCTGNSCRSQMAEGWTRQLLGERIDAYSAGLVAHGLNADAVRVMAEAGVNIAGQKSKQIDDIKNIKFDCVVTVCDHARENCPVFPGKTKSIHAGFDDPPRLAVNAQTEAERLAPYRRVRDEIREFIKELPKILVDAEVQLPHRQ